MPKPVFIRNVPIALGLYPRIVNITEESVTYGLSESYIYDYISGTKKPINIIGNDTFIGNKDFYLNLKINGNTGEIIDAEITTSKTTPSQIVKWFGEKAEADEAQQCYDLGSVDANGIPYLNHVGNFHWWGRRFVFDYSTSGIEYLRFNGVRQGEFRKLVGEPSPPSSDWVSVSDNSPEVRVKAYCCEECSSSY